MNPITAIIAGLIMLMWIVWQGYLWNMWPKDDDTAHASLSAVIGFPVVISLVISLGVIVIALASVLDRGLRGPLMSNVGRMNQQSGEDK